MIGNKSDLDAQVWLLFVPTSSIRESSLFDFFPRLLNSSVLRMKLYSIFNFKRSRDQKQAVSFLGTKVIIKYYPFAFVTNSTFQSRIGFEHTAAAF